MTIRQRAWAILIVVLVTLFAISIYEQLFNKRKDYDLVNCKSYFCSIIDNDCSCTQEDDLQTLKQ
jgi:hypothetical protein